MGQRFREWTEVGVGGGAGSTQEGIKVGWGRKG